MKNWIRKPLLWIGVLQVPVFIFIVMGGGFVGLVSVGAQTYLIFETRDTTLTINLNDQDNHHLDRYDRGAGIEDVSF